MKRKRKYIVVIERDEDGSYIATAHHFQGCYTHAKNLDTLMKRIREAIELSLEVDPDPLEPLESVGIQQITV
jgi:predicted RNase H-like HicB family nuclease